MPYFSAEQFLKIQFSELSSECQEKCPVVNFLGPEITKNAQRLIKLEEAQNKEEAAIARGDIDGLARRAILLCYEDIALPCEQNDVPAGDVRTACWRMILKTKKV